MPQGLDGLRLDLEAFVRVNPEEDMIERKFNRMATPTCMLDS